MLVDLHTLTVVNEFRSFVRPTVVTTLTDALGTSADPAKGHFTFLVTDGENPIEGATVKLTGGTAAVWRR